MKNVFAASLMAAAAFAAPIEVEEVAAAAIEARAVSATCPSYSIYQSAA